MNSFGISDHFLDPLSLFLSFISFVLSWKIKFNVGSYSTANLGKKKFHKAIAGRRQMEPAIRVRIPKSTLLKWKQNYSYC